MYRASKNSRATEVVTWIGKDKSHDIKKTEGLTSAIFLIAGILN
jgi:hypothetical protein